MDNVPESWREKMQAVQLSQFIVLSEFPGCVWGWRWWRSQEKLDGVT